MSLWLGVTIAQAELVDLRWQDGGRFERSLTIAAGKFAEVCGPLEAGQVVRWSFSADHPLNFNVHYHLGKEVRYPAKLDQVAGLEGELVVDSGQDYCWMRTNKSASPVQLSVTLTKR